MNVTFSPKLRSGADVLERWLLRIAHGLLLTAVGASVLFFLPLESFPQAFAKSFFLLTGVLLSLVIFGLFVLRIGVLRLTAPLPVALLWLFVAGAVAAALLSGDRSDALWGEGLTVGSASFLGLLALVVTATAFIVDSKRSVTYFFLAFAVGGFLVQLWHVLRLFFGPGFLSFGVLGAATDSFIGSFNDVAIFSGLLIMMGIVALLQLPLTALATGFVAVTILLSLVLLVVANVPIVWAITGFFALVVFLYVLTANRLRSTSSALLRSASSLSVPGLLFLVWVAAAVFLVAGSSISTKLSEQFSVAYVEVRPSFATTLDITAAVYRNDGMLLGVGPNRFEDAWRQYRSQVINQTMFWNTTFTAGSGFVPTLWVTTGVVGAVVLLSFLISLAGVGYRALLVPRTADPFWYFVATIALVAVGYLWMVAVLYVPGVTLLILTAFFSGLLLAAYGQLVPGAVKIFSATDQQARVFIMIFGVVAVILVTVGFLFVVYKQFAAQVIYASALGQIQSSTPEVFDASLERAYVLFPHNRFLIQRVQLKLATMRMIAATEPTSARIAEYSAAAQAAVGWAGEVVRRDGTSPQSYALLGSVYALLAMDGATSSIRELASVNFAKAQELDPQNPEYALIEAQLSAREGNLTRAREYLESALTRKPDYIDALYLLSQVDVTLGNTATAVAAARAILTLEPTNPVRHFQLGALLLAANETTEARSALDTALALDTGFANARYLRALIDIEAGNRDQALADLRLIQTTNPDNASLANLITQLERGATTVPPLGVTAPVQEATVATDASGVTTTSGDTETELIVPVNRRDDRTERPDTESQPSPNQGGQASEAESE
jgi:tetratricopeptide (TPR) repeat protein